MGEPKKTLLEWLMTVLPAPFTEFVHWLRECPRRVTCVQCKKLIWYHGPYYNEPTCSEKCGDAYGDAYGTVGAAARAEAAEAEAARLREQVLWEATKYLVSAFSEHLYDEGNLEYPDMHPEGGYWDSIREGNAALRATKGSGRRGSEGGKDEQDRD